MSLDFIRVEQDLGKDKLKLRNFKKVSSYHESGWVKYIYCPRASVAKDESLTLYYHSKLKRIRVEVSFAYFLLGHNFRVTNAQVKQGVEKASQIIGTDLMGGTVTLFEYGVIVETEHSIKEIMRHHIRLAGTKVTEYPNGKYFDSSLYVLKLYDAKRNISSKVSKLVRGELSNLGIYDSRKKYVKVEMKYEKPETYFGTGGIKLKALFTPRWVKRLDADLIERYGAIKKLGAKQAPKVKADTSCDIIYLKLLNEDCELLGIDLKKRFYDALRSIGKDLLNKNDLKGRQKTFRSQLKRCNMTGGNIYDLSDGIKKCLPSLLGRKGV